MPFGGTCSDDALGVWLSRHGLELVRSPHQASCSTEDAVMALFCKAYKSMIKPFEADLTHGRHSKGKFFLYCQGFLERIRRRDVVLVYGARVRVTAPATSGRASEGYGNHLLDVWENGRSSSKVTQTTIDNNVFHRLLSSLRSPSHLQVPIDFPDL